MRSLFHERWRGRVALLASGALGGADNDAAGAGDERTATQAHLETCAACGREFAALRDMLALVAADPIRQAEPAIPIGSLLARVNARIDAADRRGERKVVVSPRWHWGQAWTATAAVAATVALVSLRLPTIPPRQPEPEPVSSVSSVSEEVLDRLDAHVAREHAVRYLNEAQDVLVTVAATSRNCDRSAGRVDVGDEARRSRALLARRALLVEMERDEMASARPVLDDVEEMLREVASLESCARQRDLEAIHREMSRSRLLMKIGLMTRELQG